MKLMIWSLLPFSLLCMHTDRQEQMWVPALYLSFCPQRKKKVMIESLHGSSHVLIGLLFCYHYYTTTLDSTLTLIVSDMKREELYELLFYCMHSLTSIFAKKIQLIFYFFLMIRCFHKILFPGPFSWCKIRKKDFKEDFDHPKEVKNHWKLNEAFLKYNQRFNCTIWNKKKYGKNWA